MIDVNHDHNTNDTARRVAKMYVTEVFRGRYMPLPKITEFPNASHLNELMIMGPITGASLNPARAVTDAEQRLRAIITSHVHLITSRSTPQGNNPVTIVVDEVAGLTPAQRRKIDQRKRDYVELIRHTLEQLKRTGRLRELDLTAASFSLLGMILWLSRWYNPTGRLTPDQVSEEVAKIAMGGLLQPKERDLCG